MGSALYVFYVGILLKQSLARHIRLIVPEKLWVIR